MEKEALINLVNGMLQEILQQEPAYFLVDLKIKPTNNIKVYLDGDEGINIDKCIQFNRALRARIEETGLFPEGDFSLEVSSPGIEEPLKNLRQYKKNIGRKIEVTFTNAEEKEKLGKLLHADAELIIIEEKTGKGKTAKSGQVTIPLQDIKKTTVQIEF